MIHISQSDFAVTDGAGNTSFNLLLPDLALARSAQPELRLRYDTPRRHADWKLELTLGTFGTSTRYTHTHQHFTWLTYIHRQIVNIYY